MAYVDKSKKAKIKAALEVALKGTGVKYTLAVRDHSTIVCTVKSSAIDFIKNNRETIDDIRRFYEPIQSEKQKTYLDVNPYHYRDHFSGEARDIIEKIIYALNTDNYDNSDSMSDYFDKGHYVDLQIGSWKKPYELMGEVK